MNGSWGPRRDTASDDAETTTQTGAGSTSWDAYDHGDDADARVNDDTGATGDDESDGPIIDGLREGTSDDVLERGEYRFCPVLGFSSASIVCRRTNQLKGGDVEAYPDVFDDPMTIGDRELSWWESDSLMPQHEFLLINPIDHIGGIRDYSKVDMREALRVKKGDQFVFADSGGFQLVTRESAEVVDDRARHDFGDERVHPEALIEWQVKNADAGSTLDFPPYGNAEGTQKFAREDEYTEEWGEFFRRRADRAADATGTMASRLKELRDAGDHDAEDYIFAPVIQGRPQPSATDDPHRLARHWYERTREAIEDAGLDRPRGWTLSPKPATSIGQVAFFLAFAQEHLDDADHIHALQVGGKGQMPLLMYFAQYNDFMVTSDATNFIFGSKSRRFELPRTGRRRYVILSDRDDDGEDRMVQKNELDRFPCRCEVCRTVQENVGFEFCVDDSGGTRAFPLDLHNLHQILDMQVSVDALLREEDIELGGEPKNSQFWRFLNSFFTDKTLRDMHTALEYLRVTREEGLETANRRFRVLWSSSGGRTIVRASDSATSTTW